MRFLVDTHILVWQAREPERLSNRMVAILDDGEVDLHYSVASLWEVAIKNSLSRMSFTMDAAALRGGLGESGYAELDVAANHVLEVGRLEPIHGDPFDRLLLAQARVEGLVLLTVDEQVLAYGYPAQRA